MKTGDGCLFSYERCSEGFWRWFLKKKKYFQGVWRWNVGFECVFQWFEEACSMIVVIVPVSCLSSFSLVSHTRKPNLMTHSWEAKSCYWWFRNPKANHLGYKKTLNNGINHQPTSTGEFAGFLNHPQKDAIVPWHVGLWECFRSPLWQCLPLWGARSTTGSGQLVLPNMKKSGRYGKSSMVFSIKCACCQKLGKIFSLVRW